jgi:heme exporter protein A
VTGALTGEGLACRRGERWVFTGLDFALDPGGALLLRGANGSGKSSLLRLLAPLLEPAEGGFYGTGRRFPTIARYIAQASTMSGTSTPNRR